MLLNAVELPAIGLGAVTLKRQSISNREKRSCVSKSSSRLDAKFNPIRLTMRWSWLDI